jgi:hypothetical protein
LSLSILIALAGWVAVQNVGGALTGATTDVGTGPVLILLTLAFWPLTRARTQRAGERSATGARAEAQQAAGHDQAG